ncbi:MAG TPA: hypothetical protein VFJ53_02905 [Solirubrobacterales bacterium]|nr:hypothetical protein [Solirubrobacterales bacterium]
MIRRVLIGSTLVLLAISVPTSLAGATTRAFLAKPSKVSCVATKLGGPGASVRCDLPFIGHRAVFLHTRGKAKIKSVSGFLHPAHRSTLGLGREARYGQFSCKSLKTAVTCRNGDGHGFTVGRKFQLTF